MTTYTKEQQADISVFRADLYGHAYTYSNLSPICDVFYTLNYDQEEQFCHDVLTLAHELNKSRNEFLDGTINHRSYEAACGRANLGVIDIFNWLCDVTGEDLSYKVLRSLGCLFDYAVAF